MWFKDLGHIHPWMLAQPEIDPWSQVYIDNPPWMITRYTFTLFGQCTDRQRSRVIQLAESSPLHADQVDAIIVTQT